MSHRKIALGTKFVLENVKKSVTFKSTRKALCESHKACEIKVRDEVLKKIGTRSTVSAGCV